MTRLSRPVPRLALSPEEAAVALGCSLTFFKEHVAGEVDRIFIGSRVFYRVSDLEGWLGRQAITPGGKRAVAA